MSYQYFNGVAQGTTQITNVNMPTVAGNYFIVMFTNDSYNEVSNRVEFQMMDPLESEGFKIDNGINTTGLMRRSSRPTMPFSSFNATDALLFFCTNCFFICISNSLLQSRFSISSTLPASTSTSLTIFDK